MTHDRAELTLQLFDLLLLRFDILLQQSERGSAAARRRTQAVQLGKEFGFLPWLSHPKG